MPGIFGTAVVAAVISFSGLKGGTPFSVSDYSFHVTKGAPAIHLRLASQDDVKKLQALSRENLGGHIAITIDGKTTYTPLVRAPLSGDGFEISFNDPATFEAVQSSLAGGAP